jgi:hypothetical protein
VTPSDSTRRALTALAVASFVSVAFAHPGSGIGLDRQGQIYFVDTGSGLFRIDTHGTLVRHPGPAYHWMTIDPDNRFAAASLPAGANWDLARAGTSPTLLLASDFPVVLGKDGNLYHAPSVRGGRLKLTRLTPAGVATVVTELPQVNRGPFDYLNGLAAAPDGSLYFTGDDRIGKVTPDGRASIVASGIDPAGCPAIPGVGADERPLLRGLDVDADGTIVVAASGCGRLLRVTPAGKVTTLFQNESPWSPTGVVRSGRDLYVLEYLHTASDDRLQWLPRVRKISADGSTVIVAHVDRG